MSRVHGGRHSIDSERRTSSRSMMGKLIWDMVNKTHVRMWSTQHLDKSVEPKIPLSSARPCSVAFD